MTQRADLPLPGDIGMPPHEQLREHAVLLAHLASAQRRCTALLAQQQALIERQARDIVRLRGELICRETALAWTREDHARWLAEQPGLPRRRALAHQIQQLAARLHDLTRERQQGASAPAPGAAGRAVLCIGLDHQGADAARRLAQRRGARLLTPAGLSQSAPARDPAALAQADECDDSAVLEDCLRQADLVICRTGCLSQQAHWRVQDHCRRTGKPCVYVDVQPAPLQWLRVVDASLRQAHVADQDTLAS